VFARENGQGMFFEVVDGVPPVPEKRGSVETEPAAEMQAKKNHLKVVK
jgi:stringent starvation protein B